MIAPAPAARRCTLAAWVAYEMALHGYALMIPAVGYALHFTSFVAAGEAHANLLWSIAVAIPLLVSGLLAPLLGALADARGWHRALLAAAKLACAAAMAALALPEGRGRCRDRHLHARPLGLPAGQRPLQRLPAEALERWQRRAHLGARLGPELSRQQRAVLLSLAIWAVVLLLMAFATGSWAPLAIVGCLGLVLGSTQSLCRSMFARLFPSDRAGEYYGFHALAGRASSALGPLLFGLVALAGSQRAAMASLALFLAAGGWLLLTLRLERAARPQPAAGCARPRPRASSPASTLPAVGRPR